MSEVTTTKISVKGGMTVKIPSGVKYGDLTINIQTEVSREYSGPVDEKEVLRELSAIATGESISEYKGYKAVLDQANLEDFYISTSKNNTDLNL